MSRRPPLLALLAAATCLWGVAAVVLLALQRLQGGTRPAAVVAAAAAVALMLIAAGRLREPVTALARRAAAAATRPRAAVWLGGCIALGWILRLLWIALLPPVQRSDWLGYFHLALGLVQRGEYHWGDISVYLPPGLPLTLAVVMTVVGAHAWVVQVVNLAAFAAAVVVTWALGRRLAGEGVARLAAALLVAWPNLVLLASLAVKENLTLALLPAVLLLYLVAVDAHTPRRRGGAALAAGGVLGWAVLTQPANMMLPAVFLLFELRRRDGWRRAAARWLPLVVGVVIVVSPWTVRNWLRYHAFVPVAANGGHSLLVGNNPDATGGWIPIRSRYPHDDEVAYDRMAGRLALRWMGEHPLAVLLLVVPKQLLFLGDDADAAYDSLKRTYDISDLRYAAAKAVSLAYWLALLASAALALWWQRHRSLLADPRFELLLLPLLYLLALLSITESGGRHHIALAGCLAIFAALAALPEEDAESAPSGAGRE